MALCYTFSLAVLVFPVLGQGINGQQGKPTALSHFRELVSKVVPFDSGELKHKDCFRSQTAFVGE